MCNVQTNPGPQLDAQVMAASIWIQIQTHSDQDNHGGQRYVSARNEIFNFVQMFTIAG